MFLALTASAWPLFDLSVISGTSRTAAPYGTFTVVVIASDEVTAINGVITMKGVAFILIVMRFSRLI